MLGFCTPKGQHPISVLSKSVASEQPPTVYADVRMLFDDVNRFHQAPYRDDPFYALMLQAEFYVPLQHAEAALKALQPVAGALSGWRSADEWVGRPEGLEGLVIGTEIRLVKGAGLECWMSPFREDSLAIHFSFKHDMAAALVACRTLQRCLAPFGGRVHWGKLFDAEEFGTGGTGDGRTRLEMLFPNVNDFRALCQRHDPGGKFRNAYLNKLLF